MIRSHELHNIGWHHDKHTGNQENATEALSWSNSDLVIQKSQTAHKFIQLKTTDTTRALSTEILYIIIYYTHRYLI